MAMRWSYCSLATVTLAAACVTTTTRAFLPSPHNPHYTASKAEPVLAENLRLQCEALRKAQRPDSGTARFVIDVDSLGVATRAELRHGTSDDLLDGVFGTVAAQLTFDRAPRARREPVAVQYHCAGDSAHVVVRRSGQ